MKAEIKNRGPVPGAGQQHLWGQYLLRYPYYAKYIAIAFLCIVFTQQELCAQKSATDMVKEAKKNIENLTAQKAAEEIAKGNVVLIDIRKADELKQGKIAGAINAPRGMLEFYADPTLPYYKPEKEAGLPVEQ